MATGNFVTFSSPTSFTMGKNNGKTWNGTVEYSTDAITWTTWNGTDTLTAVSDSGTYYIYLRGTSNTGWGRSSKSDKLTFTGSNISVAGNIETLLDYATVALGNHPQMANYCFKSLFYESTALVSAENFELPATTLASYCYQYMFYGCTSLTSAPALPATTLANNCYDGMFYQCTSLTSAPALPATTLASYCYQSMLSSCTSLTSAPEISATTLADYCCTYMFLGCTSLTSLPALPATTLAAGCYQQMFQGCSSLKISETQTGEYQYAYRIPTEGTGTTASSALYNFFYGTGGTFTGTPSINTTYYTDHKPVTPSTGDTVTIEYNNSTLATLTGESTVTMDCNGCVMEDDVVITKVGTENNLKVAYNGSNIIDTDNEGTHTLVCANKLMASNLVVTVSEIAQTLYAVTFSSPNSFTMGKTNGKTWDGTVEYSTDASTWTTWNGTDTLTAVLDSGTYYIYLRGISNTGWGRSSENDPLTLTGSNISVAGNIETLLDYATVALGNHPQMADYCFKSLFYRCTALVSAENLKFPAPTLTTYCYNTMFLGCTSLTSAPALPATTLATYCYLGMFYDCTSLVSAPALPATTLVQRCYRQMFYGCSSLKISQTQTGEYQYAYRIPTEGTGTTATNALSNMFSGTGGTFTGDPSINTTYYTDHQPVSA